MTCQRWLLPNGLAISETAATTFKMGRGGGACHHESNNHVSRRASNAFCTSTARDDNDNDTLLCAINVSSAYLAIHRDFDT
jgi:hypothetical protein